MADTETIKLDIISDPICPWCYIGKTHLDKALAEVPDHPFVIEWHPFQLNPDMPDGGMDRRAYLEGKFGGKEGAVRAYAPVVENAEKAGLKINFDKMLRTPNTLDAHRVLQLAEREEAPTSELAEAIMRGFFEDGDDISDSSVLEAHGKSIGLKASDIKAILGDEASRDIVLGQEAHVRKSGVTGVPNFLINKRLFVSGAQPTEVLLSVFDRAMFGEESDQPASEVLH